MPRGLLSVIAPPSHQSPPTCNEMKWRDFLPVPKNRRRTRSEARSEVGSLKNPSEVNLVAPHPAESTPDLRIGPSTVRASSSLTSGRREFNGTWTLISRIIYLTTLFPRTTDPRSGSDQFPSIPGRDRSNANHQKKSLDHTIDPRATSKGKSRWGSTVYATTKLAINLVKESSDAFPPLKSVAGGLSAILNHCDVQYISLILPHLLCLQLS